AMPKVSGLDATSEIHRAHPRMKILVLSMNEGDEYFYKALRAGACGYVLKKAADAELREAIVEVMRGGTYLREPTARRILQDLAATPAPEFPPSAEVLTEREVEVLTLLATGLTNQEIADRLIISPRTVETHRAHIIDKLGIRRRSELVQYAMRKGLVT
ncbi:MAG: response regulator transcription factor, partial [Cyanobacteria bacterium REEB65]|nr:response regulator transcription factor [Cyanobacteria bacterium REEB65]